MTGPEKRHFTLFSQRHIIGPENNYLRLFDAMDAQKDYDEDAILEKFANEKFAKQLHRIKNYLYELILRSLAEFHKNKTIGGEIRSKLESAEILFAKGLPVQANKILTAVRELIEIYEQPHFWPELLELEKKYLNYLSGNQDFSELIDEHSNQFRLAQEQLGELNSNWENAARVSTRLNAFGLPQNETERQKLIEIFKESISNPGELHGFDSREYYFQNCSHFYHLLGDLEQAFTFSGQHIDWYQEHEFFIRDRLRRYVAVLTNHLLLAIRLGKRDERYEELRLKLFSIGETYSNSPHNTREFQWHLFRAKTSVILYELLSCHQTQNPQVSLRELENEFAGFGKYTLTGRRAGFLFNMARVSLVYEDFIRANKFLNLIINSGPDAGGEIFHEANLLSLVVFFESGKMELIKPRIKQMRRFCQAEIARSEAVEILLSLFWDLAGTRKNKSGAPDLFNNALNNLEFAFKNNPIDRGLAWFDYFSWLESRTENKPIREIIFAKIEAGNYTFPYPSEVFSP
jgi:hypothetical protein